MRELCAVRIKTDKWDPRTDEPLYVMGDELDIPLYHWSPAERRTLIQEQGLVPSNLSVDSSWNPPYLCFAETPSYAWGLSGGMQFYPDGEYDLWQTQLSDLIDPYIIQESSRPSRIKEVRTEDEVTRLWYVGSRLKEL